MEEHRLIGKRIQGLREMVLKMGNDARASVEKAMQSIVERDSDLAAEVIAYDDVIDRQELEIDRELIEIFALLQPAARDLRFVIAVAKINPILERMADHCVNIANAAIELNHEPQLAEYVDLPKMAARASDMLKQAIDAFTQEDSTLARRVIALDKDIDALYQKVVRELVEYMRTEPASSTRVLQLLFTAKHLERIGDYVKDICELTVYMIEAQFIRHAENQS